MATYFGVVDYVILAVVLVASLAVGIASGWRRSTTTREFLTGGNNMNPAAVCLSLLGGVVSSISLQGNSTEMYLYGTQLWLNVLGCAWGSLVVIFLILPVVYPLNLVSVCEYLELRYQSPLLKKLGSLTLILNSFMYLGICLYAPSLAVSSVMGIPTTLSLIILGVICAIYISFGGVRAVVYTDVLQTLMMFIGVLVVVIKVTTDLGGLSQVWEIANQGERIQFL
ncbi:Sodium-coupled monocarboxylate transporter 1, partial [Halocaridina rubra]